jgi:hypothetical protein
MRAEGTPGEMRTLFDPLSAVKAKSIVLLPLAYAIGMAYDTDFG